MYKQHRETNGVVDRQDFSVVDLHSQTWILAGNVDIEQHTPVEKALAIHRVPIRVSGFAVIVPQRRTHQNLTAVVLQSRERE